MSSSRREIPEDAAALAAETGARAAATTLEAVSGADFVVLAVPFSSSGESLAREIAPAVRGKVVIDVTNPVKPTYDGLLTAGGPSAAERFAEWLPEATVVKAFNTLFAATQAEPIVDGVQLDGFVAADDIEAKARVLELVRSIGLRPIDAGPLVRARELEALAWLNISLQGTLGNGWRTGWKLVGIPAGALEPAAQARHGPGRREKRSMSIPVARLNHAVLWVRTPRRRPTSTGASSGSRSSAPRWVDEPCSCGRPAATTTTTSGLFSVGPAAPNAPRGSVGLYHLAWEVPTIDDLASAAGVLSEAGALAGASDHGVSKSLYGQDPDGNEFEVMWRVPREAWGEYEHQGAILPLDLDREVARWGAKGAATA